MYTSNQVAATPDLSDLAQEPAELTLDQLEEAQGGVFFIFAAGFVAGVAAGVAIGRALS